MSNHPIKKLSEAGRNAAKVVSDHMLKVARPLFWHIGANNRGIPKGASAFILQFDECYIGVTADHVMESYFTALTADGRIKCQLGQCEIRPQDLLIARSKKLDIATFDIDPKLLGTIGADALDCRGQWPPLNVEVGDTLTLAGFLDNHRTKLSPQRYEMLAYGGHGIVDAITASDIITTYDPQHMMPFESGVTMPPLGFNMSGCSGGPVVAHKIVNGLLRWFPVGLIYEGPYKKSEDEKYAGPYEKATGEFAQFDRIRVRKLHFLNPDGTLNEPDSGSGWLPE